jgi:hypothetical protein
MSYHIDDCEPCDYHKSKIRKARKQHKCTACGRAIKPGHYYRYVTGKFDDHVYTVKRCGACERTYQHLQKVGDGELIPDENLDCGLDYQEEHRQPPPPEIAKLPFLSDDEAGALLGVAD